jgi:hypothetical protein
MKIGKNMKHALEFSQKHKGWHTFKNDRATKAAIEKLAKLKLVVINEFNQFKAV